MNEPLEADASSNSSTSDSGSDVDEIMDTFKEQIQGLEPALTAVETQIASITKRLASAQKEWMDLSMTPRTAAIQDWCCAHGLSDRPTLRTWFSAVLATALVADCETRSLVFLPEEAALWSDGKPAVPLFDLLRNMPKWFELPSSA